MRAENDTDFLFPISHLGRNGFLLRFWDFIWCSLDLLNRERALIELFFNKPGLVGFKVWNLKISNLSISFWLFWLGWRFFQFIWDFCLDGYIFCWFPSGIPTLELKFLITTKNYGLIETHDLPDVRDRSRVTWFQPCEHSYSVENSEKVGYAVNIFDYFSFVFEILLRRPHSILLTAVRSSRPFWLRTSTAWISCWKVSMVVPSLLFEGSAGITVWQNIHSMSTMNRSASR